MPEDCKEGSAHPSQLALALEFLAEALPPEDQSSVPKAVPELRCRLVP